MQGMQSKPWLVVFKKHTFYAVIILDSKKPTAYNCVSDPTWPGNRSQKEAELDARMAKIRAQNAEREKRHLEVEADKKKAEADKSAVKVSGSTSKDDEGKWIQTTLEYTRFQWRLPVKKLKAHLSNILN